MAGLLFTVVTDANGIGLLNGDVWHTIESSSGEIEILGVARERINVYRSCALADLALDKHQAEMADLTGELSMYQE